MKIAITKSETKFERYTGWLDHFKVDYEILDYENSEGDEKKLATCCGLILSGGVDIYPEIYCDWDTVKTRGSYIPERDGFELKIIERALDLKIPILAICRGLQLMNVYFRGSLIFDLEEIRNVNHEKISGTEDRFHDIRIIKNTLLHEVLNTDSEKVNSSHHQSVDRLGEGLMINAKSNDGIIEGIEYSDKSDKPFFIGVQCHPERFPEYDSPVSEILLKRFLIECAKNS